MTMNPFLAVKCELPIYDGPLHKLLAPGGTHSLPAELCLPLSDSKLEPFPLLHRDTQVKHSGTDEIVFRGVPNPRPEEVTGTLEAGPSKSQVILVPPKEVLRLPGDALKRGGQPDLRTEMHFRLERTVAGLKPQPVSAETNATALREGRSQRSLPASVICCLRLR